MIKINQIWYILGDRFELLEASAATIFRIPIAHLHGGDLQSGFDDSIRHAISQLSHLHFVANEIYRKRVIQLGEDPHNVFNVDLGVDAIKTVKLSIKINLKKS